MSLEGKTALVTGGAQGIGYAIAHKLLTKGAQVVIADINEEKAREAGVALSSMGPDILTLGLDVANEVSINQGIQKVTSEMGSIAILINNAGIYRSTPLEGNDTLVNWKSCLDVMLTGSFMLARAVAPFMMKQKWGRIVNLGSLMSHNAFGEDAAYCAAKTGILGLTRSLSADLAKYNICINTVCPGNILTDMLRKTAVAVENRDGLETGSWLRDQGKRIPMGRLGSPEDIAKAVAFFCSEDADYITGQTLHVNGGQYYQ